MMNHHIRGRIGSMTPKPKTGPTRWKAAFTNSVKGLQFGWRNEAAIREELIALLVSIPLACLLADAAWQAVVMVLSVLLVLIVEVLNSAIEAALDRISTEHHPLTGAAKDLGSLAVLLAIIFAAAVWLTVILT